MAKLNVSGDEVKGKKNMGEGKLAAGEAPGSGKSGSVSKSEEGRQSSTGSSIRGKGPHGFKPYY